MDCKNFDAEKELKNIVRYVFELRNNIFIKKAINDGKQTHTDKIIYDFMCGILKQNVEVVDDIYYSKPFKFVVYLESEK